MNKASLNCAVVGVGYLGRFHAQKYKLESRANLIGVYDASFERAQVVANELKVKAFRTVEEVASSVSAVSIAAATTSHFELGKYFLSKGIHCLVEKPITVISPEARELVELAKAKSCKLQVGHIERFNPAWRAAGAEFGPFSYAQFARIALYKPRGVDANVVFDLMIHDIDLALALADQSRAGAITKIVAHGQRVVSAEVDFVQAQLTFESGAIVDLMASRISPETDRRARIFMKNKSLTIDMGSGQLHIARVNSAAEKPEDKLQVQTIAVEKQDALQAEIGDFVGAIIEGRSSLVPGAEGLRAVEIAERIISAIRA